MRRWLVLAGLTMAVASALAQVPAADLAKPPADARHYIIQSTGGKHGDSWTWVAPDGTRMGRESMNLRGQVFELDSSGKAGRGRHAGDARDPRRHAAGRRRRNLHHRRRQGELEEPGGCGQRGVRDAGVLFLAQGGPIDMTAWLLERLLASPDQTLDAAARRQGARREANYPHGGRGRQQEGSDGLGDHRRQQLADPGLGGCQQQVLRLLVSS